MLPGNLLSRLWNRLPRRQLAVYGFYLAVIVVVTWPLAAGLSTQLVGDDSSDAYEMGRNIWWFKYALQTGQPLFFQPLLAYPDGLMGVSLWSNPLQFFPAWLLAFVMPVSSAYNLTVMLTMGLNGWAMYALARQLLSKSAVQQASQSAVSNQQPAVSQEHSSLIPHPSPLSVSLPALLAGLVFMLFPTMQGHLMGGHAGLLVMWPMPLYAGALLRLLDAPGRRNLALAVLFFVLVPLGHSLQVFYVLMPITGVAALALLLRRDWRRLGRVVAVSLIGSALLLAFLYPVIDVTLETPAYVEEVSSVVRYSADLLAVVSPSFQHPLFGALLDYPHRVLGTNLVEGSAYIGVIAGSLALLGVWKRRAARGWLALGLAAWVLSLGPLLKVFDTPLVFESGGYESRVVLPWALVEDLPGFELARTPGRFNFVLALAVAAMAGYGAAVFFDPGHVYIAAYKQVGDQFAFKQYATGYGGLWGNIKLFVIPPLLAAGIIYEYQFFWPVPTIPAEIPAPILALGQREDVRAVLDVPWENHIAAKEGVYLQTGHHKPLVAGQVTRQTTANPAKLALLQDTLDPALLNAAGADIVIVHKFRDDPGAIGPVETFARQKLGAPFFENDYYAVFEAPETDAEPGFLSLSAATSLTPSQFDSYLYMPEPGWVDFTAYVTANDRDVALSLDGVGLQTWAVSGAFPLRLFLPVGARGYHTVTLNLEPPCPQHYDDTLTCRALRIDGVQFRALTAGPLYDPIELEKGVRLAARYLPERVQPGETLQVGLWWQFAEARSADDVRFAHVLDASGGYVAQFDSPIGARPTGSEWAERLDLRLPADVAPGVYTVYTGWYTYPDNRRFKVLSDTPGAENDLVYVGTFEVGG